MSSTQPQPAINAIPYSPEYWERLKSLVHSVEELKKDGYKLEPLDSKAIQRLRRCRNCHLRMQKRTRKPKSDDLETRLANVSLDQEGGDPADAASIDDDVEEPGTIAAVEEDPTQEKKAQKPKYVCRFHPGTVVSKHFTCCQSYVAQPGCTFAEQHESVDYALGELEAYWALYKTPQSRNKHKRYRKAVALDCEMGTSTRGEKELIRLTAVDFFTGEVLVDSLVYPSVPMQHFNTRYSGVTRGMLEAARRKKTCIMGRDAARQRLWRYVGPETIVVVHGGHNDFLALRWIHLRVVDTFLVARAAREKKKKKQQQQQQEQQPDADGVAEKRGLSLKDLADAILGWQIQRGKQGHCSLEDALACRALADWYVRNLAEDVRD